jgi:hypothetical protein
MKEVPKKDTAEVAGGVQAPDGSRSGLVIPGMPLPMPTYPTEPCVPLTDSTRTQLK